MTTALSYGPKPAAESIDALDARPTKSQFHGVNQSSFLRNATRSFNRPAQRSKPLHKSSLKISAGKQWHPKFFAPRACADRPITDRRIYWGDEEEEEEGCNTLQPDPQETLDEDDLLDIFLGDSEGSIPSWEARVVREFFSKRANQAPASEDCKPWAWLDDREHETGRSRDFPQALDPSKLRAALSHERFKHPQLCNTDRRLIYISRLTPAFILALSETAWDHQADALRDAICKHIVQETSFRVDVSMHGFITFRLEFHLAHFILRPAKDGPDPATAHSTRVRQPVADLSFLMQSPAPSDALAYEIHAANISVFICGWSNTQWTGYAFANTGLEDQPFREQEEYGPKQDLFAADREDDYIKDADRPTWDARKYWLQTIGIRCQLVLKEWSYLVHTVEEAIESWRSRDPCSNSKSSTNKDANNIQRSLDCTLQTMQLLRKLRDSLAATLRAYKRFSASNGDKSYFSDIRESDTRAIEDNIAGSFEKLTDLYLRLTSLDDSCKRFATHLGRILSLESNRLTADSNALNQESNKLNIQSLNLSKQTQELGKLTNEVNEKIRKLNEESTDAVRASQEVAAKTSHSTRVNVELLLLTTPFGMVLQYFGSDKDIFSFNRNPKTFVLSTVVLMLVLRVITYLLEHSGRLIRMVPWKILSQPGRTRSVVTGQGKQNCRH